MATAVSSLGQHLGSAQYILALLGAGLSASSGIQTYRGAGGLWKTYDAKDLATRSAFARDPVLVWQFFEDRRITAMKAQPNAGHFALAQLAQATPHFVAITQNVDGLSERAGHDLSKLVPIHGSLFATTCFNPDCTLVEWHSTAQRVVLSVKDLPRCPVCRHGLQRPGVVWFGEPLPQDLLARTDQWLESLPRIDILLVVGTSATVFPAAEYISRAREKGAFVAHFNTVRDDELMCAGDWYVPGDAAVTLPRVVEEALNFRRTLDMPCGSPDDQPDESRSTKEDTAYERG